MDIHLLIQLFLFSIHVVIFIYDLDSVISYFGNVGNRMSRSTSALLTLSSLLWI